MGEGIYASQEIRVGFNGHGLCVRGRKLGVESPFHQQQESLISPRQVKVFFQEFWKALHTCTISKAVRKLFNIKMTPRSYGAQFIM